MAREKKTMDGNSAAAHVSYAYSDVAAIYPITPSSAMAELSDKWAAEGRKNIFGQEVLVHEMQSEAGAAGAVHGSLAAGALTTTFTASQGLLLMIPNMYKMAGELLPAVIDVSARAVASHALSIFGDHSDVYACRQTGFAMLCASSVQEVMDLTPVSHCSAVKGRVPFLNFFDGFRTSHEIQKIEVWDYETLREFIDVDAVAEYRNSCLNPNHPVQRGQAQNPDIFFQTREAANVYYDRLPEIVEEYMGRVNEKAGTDYKLFNYYGAPDAKHIIIAMGSVCETIEETVDYLLKHGEKVGVVKVRLYRPFSAKHLIDVIPKSVEAISVLDRTKEPGAIGEPLYLDVVAALKDSAFKNAAVFSGRYGLASKDTAPEQIIAVYKNREKRRFTIGITDDVTNLSLPVCENADTAHKSVVRCKFWGLGADGTVGAAKNTIKIIGDNTELYAQAYFEYDSKKSGGVTVSHLRFGNAPIKSTYLIKHADFVACHNPAYIYKYDMVQDIKRGGTFLLNCSWPLSELDKRLPASVKKFIAHNDIKFYIIDGFKLAKEAGLGGRINTILQAAFFKLTGILPQENAAKLMKRAVKDTYGKKGEDIVEMNCRAIDRGFAECVRVDVPEDWKNEGITDKKKLVTGNRKDAVDFVNNIQTYVNEYKGNSLPVSTFLPYADGTTPLGTSEYEKRGVATEVPKWLPENCIQCNFCSYVCPHAVIRPAAMTDKELKEAPLDIKSKDMTGMTGLKFAITISALDCTGCGSCVNVCPGMKGRKALTMKPLQSQLNEQRIFDYARGVSKKPEIFEKFKETTVKGSQFKQPLLEYSGACAGCGETPYAKLVTQLFGERAYIANATGCSSIWGNSSPSTPYTVTPEGRGPAWSNSLFEDNAEFGFGMKLAQNAMRKSLRTKVEYIAKNAKEESVKTAAAEYIKTFDYTSLNETAADKLISVLSSCNCDEAQEILKYKDFLSKKSQWIFGGDGWAYDIGFGGLDHVIASGQDVNILVFDTEVYSNTGGQSSKATPVGATAQFAAGGKDTAKKDLAQIAMSYGNVYVAQIAQGADMNQCIKALVEAESYPGPSLIIAYAPCISHGISGGMSQVQTEQKKAVASGYWHLFRYNPLLKAEGKNPFILDSKAPTTEYNEFLRGEVRYSTLERSNPIRAKELFERAKKAADDKYQYLSRLSGR